MHTDVYVCIYVCISGEIDIAANRRVGRSPFWQGVAHRCRYVYI